MSQSSDISWCDATWPIVAGCEYVSPGCSNCWAVRDSWRLAHNPHRKVSDAYFGTVDKTDAGKLVWSGIVRELPLRLGWPLKWRGNKRVFVCSQADLFHRKVSNEFIAAAFGVMAACPQHTFQVLTKHPARMREWFEWVASQQNGAAETCAWEVRYMAPAHYGAAPAEWPLENVWLGTTVEDQKRADERIPELLRAPAAKWWLSVEPMLEAITTDLTYIDWVVCGGESAQTRANTRPFNIQWARALHAQCRAAGVPFFMKQLGTQPFIEGENIVTFPYFKLDFAPKSSRYKWHEPEHWPQDLRVQNFPE